MASTICGFCGKDSHMTPVWGSKVDPGAEFSWYIVQGAFTCDHCRRLSVAAFTDPWDHGVDGTVADRLLLETSEPVEWFPKIGEAPAIEDVPPAVTAAAEEAYRAASVQAFMASILMARTVIEATAKSKGITAGNLVNKIDKMKDQNLIRPDIALVAHEIRHFGNDMAHGDIEDRPNGQDCEDVLSLMAQVLAEVFQGPALLARVQARRATK